jgi:hypothetical protein
MDNPSIFPKAVLAAIEIAYENIIRQPKDLWDEATALLVEKLRAKAEQDHQLNGSKFLADVQEHLEHQQDHQIYLVVKRRECSNVMHC